MEAESESPGRRHCLLAEKGDRISRGKESPWLQNNKDKKTPSQLSARIKLLVMLNKVPLVFIMVSGLIF